MNVQTSIKGENLEHLPPKKKMLCIKISITQWNNFRFHFSFVDRLKLHMAWQTAYILKVVDGFVL